MIRHDESDWPLVIDTPPAEASDETVLAYINRHRGYLARRELYGAVLDMRGAKMMGARHRRMLADWLAEQRQELKEYHAAVAIVLSSSLARGFVSAVYWLSPPPYPYLITATVDEAREWVLKEIEKRETAANGGASV